MTDSRFLLAEAALAFMLAGNATLTLRSAATGTRYTYKVRRAEDNPAYKNSKPTYFVSLLSGPDNENDFTYLGLIQGSSFRTTAKSKLKMESAPVKAISWAIGKLFEKKIPEQLEIWHEGKCGRCGRTLTVPESIASGFGPECITRIAA